MGGVILLVEFLQQRAAFVSTSEKQKEVSRREIWGRAQIYSHIYIQIYV